MRRTAEGPSSRPEKTRSLAELERSSSKEGVMAEGVEKGPDHFMSSYYKERSMCGFYMRTTKDLAEYWAF